LYIARQIYMKGQAEPDNQCPDMLRSTVLNSLGCAKKNKLFHLWTQNFSLLYIIQLKMTGFGRTTQQLKP